MSFKLLLFKLVCANLNPVLLIPLILSGNTVSATAGIVRHQRIFGLNQNQLPEQIKNPG